MNFLKNLFTKTFNALAPQNYQGIAKAETAVDKGRTISMTNAQSKRYTYGDDLGLTRQQAEAMGPLSPGEKTNLDKSGYTGLYTARQMHEADIDTSEEDRSNDVQEKNIDSTCVAGFKYNPKNKVAEVTFRSGGTYAYPNVSEANAKYMLRAPSKGQYFWKGIQPHSQPGFRGKA